MGTVTSNDDKMESLHDVEKGGEDGTSLLSQQQQQQQGVATANPNAKETKGEMTFDSAYVTKILPALSSWLLLSIALILFNKYLFMHVFPHPVTLTLIHMGFATLATQALRVMGRLEVPSLGWPLWFQGIVPIGAMFALSLVCSNQAAMRLTVSFIQMVKAATPMLVLAVAALFGTEKATPNLIVIVSMMTVGVGIASWGELEFDAWGMVFQVVALVVETFRLLFIQRLVQQHLPRSNPLVALSLFAPVCFVVLLPFALTVEPKAIAALLTSTRVQTFVFGNALTAFGLNATVVWLVSFESGPLTLTLAGILKDIAIIVSSVWLFRSRLTLIQIVGCEYIDRCFFCLN
jgi:hypothetical protein